AIDSDANTVAWNWDFTSAAVDSGLLISESSASTSGTQDQQALVEITTLATSTAAPLQITSNSTDVGDIFIDLASAGDFHIRNSGTAFVQFDDSGASAFGEGGNYALISSTGNLQLFGSAEYLVAGNEFAFRYATDTAFGLKFNSSDSEYDFTTTGGATIFAISAAASSGYVTLQNEGAFRYGDADGSNYVAFKSAATVGTNVTWTLPSADSSGCFQSNGSGTISIASCGGAITADSLDFTDFSDSMTLDATTSIAFGASTLSLTFTNNGSGNEVHNLSSTGDIVFQDNSSEFARFNDNGSVSFILDSTDNPDFSVTNQGSSGIIFDLTGTGDFLVRDNGSTFLSVTDTGGFSLTLDSTDNPAYSLINNGSADVSTNLAGTGDFVIQDNGTAFATFSDSGMVGIGDTTPDDLLNIHSAAAAAGMAITSLGTDTDPYIKFELADGTGTFTMGVDDSDSDKFKISTTALGTSDRLVIDSSGNVAVGTSTPLAKLHVGAGTDSPEDVISTIAIFENAGASSLSVRDATSNVEAYIYADSGGVFFGSSTSSELHIGAAGNNHLTIATNGAATFSSTLAASNLSGTNTGNVTLGAIGSSANANGATLTGQVLNLEPASGSFGGVVTTGSQTFAGVKGLNTGLRVVGSTNDTAILSIETSQSTATSQLQIGGSTNIQYNMASRYNGIPTITSDYAFAQFVIGQNAVSENGTGTHPLLATMAIKPLTVTAGAAAVTNSATLYIENADNAVTASGAYALWSDAGTNRFDGSTIFGTTISPQANDGAALGTGALAFSDAFLADGGVINFNNGNYTLTHSAGLLTANGALSIGTSNAFTTGTIELGAASDTTLARSGAGDVTIEGNAIYRAGGTDVPVADGGTGVSTLASNGVLYGNGTGAIQALAVNAGATLCLTQASSAAPAWGSCSGASGATAALDNLASVAINTSLVLGTSDGGALGSATKMWSDLFLASGGVINWNNGDVTITHGADSLTFDGGGTVFNEAGGNFDFRIEGDTNANLFVADASADKVGIGTAAPATRLHVYKSIASNYDSQITMEEGQADAYAQISFIGTGREWHFGVGGGSETSFSVANKFYIWDQQAAAMRLKIDTLGQLELPSLTLTDTGSQFDVNVTLGNDAGADTVSGINLDMTSVDTGADSDVLQAITIANLSGGNANVTETAISIGTGWDTAINIGSGQIVTSNQGIEFTESDTNPTCSSGNYTIYADTSEAKLKKCNNGVVSDLQAVPDMLNFEDTTSLPAIVDADTTEYWNDTTRPNITPKTSADDVLVMVNVDITATSSTDTQLSMRIMRHTSAITCQSVGTALKQMSMFEGSAAGSFALSTVFVDSPGTASNVIYTLCSELDSEGAVGTLTSVEFTLFDINATTADLAEVYPTNDTSLKQGDVVSIDSMLTAGVKKSNGAYDKNVMGVVSTSPAMIIGSKGSEGADGKPIALSGRVPVNVNMENGPIHKGDVLTASSTPGVAMRMTKAGMMIAIALEDYNGEGVKPIMSFVKTGSYNGSNLKDILKGTVNDPAQLTQDAIGKTALQYFMQQKGAQLQPPLDVSEILADRVTAGLEVISPRVVTDQLAVNTVEVATGDAIKIKLGTGQQFSIFTATNEDEPTQTDTPIADTETPLVTIDALGNALFAGKITAKEIEAGKIKGLEMITSQLNILAESQEGSQQGLALTASALDALNAALGVVQTNVTELQEGVTQTTDVFSGLSATLESLSARADALEALTASKTLADLESVTSGALTVSGVAQFSGEVVFEGGVSFKNIEFTVPPLFNADTAGFALIKTGDRRAKIEFEHEYVATPVVTAGVTFETEDALDDTAAEALFAENVQSLVVEKSAAGFTILLNKPAPRDMRFSWIALAVRDPKVFESIFEGLTIESVLPPAPEPTQEEQAVPETSEIAPVEEPTTPETPAEGEAVATPEENAEPTTEAAPVPEETPTETVDVSAPENSAEESVPSEEVQPELVVPAEGGI
ncbi:MAG TPA: hypothetical protein VLB02_01590, partial [Candidatus Paceibacterota bacterium]|nr:hypothetical protein [Candidatus Paceibacterota bacterium]